MRHPQLDPPISPLHQRLIDDMNKRRFSGETQRSYLRDIRRLATFLGHSPDIATADDLRRFQILHDGRFCPAQRVRTVIIPSTSRGECLLINEGECCRVPML